MGFEGRELSGRNIALGGLCCYVAIGFVRTSWMA